MMEGKTQEVKMSKDSIDYSITSGIDAVDALQKLLGTNANFASKKFIKKYNKVINELDDKRTKLYHLSLSPNIDEETKRQLINKVEEIQLTFAELKRLSETIYDLMNKYPGNMPKPIENAWAIFGDLLWGKSKIPFIFGFRAGTIFSLKYGNIWETQSGENQVR
jgi:hypothetical protein